MRGMLTADVFKFFKTQVAVARFLDISPTAVSKWPEVVPEGSAYKLQVLTKNKLRVDPLLYPKSPHNRAA